MALLSFKAMFLTVTVLMGLGIGAFMAYFIHQAAVEAELSEGRFKAVNDCAAQVGPVSQSLLAKGTRDRDASRVTASASHYNSLLHTCFVEVTIYEHRETPVFVKTLVKPSDNSAVLWSVTEREQLSPRQCFGADSMPLSCLQTEQRWKEFMRD